MEYYSIGKFSKLIGKNAQALREWDKKCELKSHRITQSGIGIIHKNNSIIS